MLLVNQLKMFQFQLFLSFITVMVIVKYEDLILNVVLSMIVNWISLGLNKKYIK